MRQSSEYTAKVCLLWHTFDSKTESEQAEADRTKLTGSAV